jgi:hypothetical protein
MDRGTRNSAMAAAIILLIFGGGWFVMPSLMLAVGKYSTLAAFVIAVMFVGAFFVIFWLRARSQQHRDGG